MRISNEFQHYEAERQIYSVLVMHFQEGITQAEIAKLTNLSHAKVNRLIKQGRELGMVEISIRSQYQALFDLESRFKEATGLETVRITPTASANPEDDPPAGRRRAPPTCCSRLVQDGDTVCITGGKGVSAVVAALAPDRSYAVEVVPATGCVQGKHYTDVNHVATADGRAARRPGLPDPRAALRRQRRRERDMLMGMKAVTRRLRPRAPGAGRACSASARSCRRTRATTTCIRAPRDDRAGIEKAGAAGELLAHLIDENGRVCDYELNSRLVALSPEELDADPASASASPPVPRKCRPICAALRGRHVKAHGARRGDRRSTC